MDPPLQVSLVLLCFSAFHALVTPLVLQEEQLRSSEALVGDFQKRLSELETLRQKVTTLNA